MSNEENLEVGLELEFSVIKSMACRDWFICCRLGSIPNGAGSMVKYVVSFFSNGIRSNEEGILDFGLKVEWGNVAGSKPCKAAARVEER